MVACVYWIWMDEVFVGALDVDVLQFFGYKSHVVQKNGLQIKLFKCKKTISWDKPIFFVSICRWLHIMDCLLSSTDIWSGATCFLKVRCVRQWNHYIRMHNSSLCAVASVLNWLSSIEYQELNLRPCKLILYQIEIVLFFPPWNASFLYFELGHLIY